MRLSPETVAKLRAGDREAFALVVGALTPVVRKIVSCFWKRPWEQEDAMQEIWAHAYRNRDAIDPSRPGDLPGWIAVLARRRCVDLLRGRNLAAPSAEDPAETLEALEAPAEQERGAEAAAVAGAVQRFRAGLAPAWRLFFDAYFVNGLAYPEISEALGISRLRCRYMRKVLAAGARKDPAIMAAIGRAMEGSDATPAE